MSQSPLAPPPQTGQPIDSWLYLLWRRLTQTGQILWDSITPGTSADVAAVVTDETGSPGSLVFSGNPTLQGVTVDGVAYVGDSTTPAGLPISGALFSSNEASGTIACVRRSSDTAGVAASISFIKSKGTAASPAAITSGHNLGAYNFYGFDGTNYSRAGQLLVQSEGTVSTGIVQGKLYFLTTDSAGVLREGFAVDSAQVATIGGTSTAPALKVTPVASQARWIEVTGATSSGNPTLTPSGGNLAIAGTAEVSGNLVFTGTANRITGDFSTATIANRVMIQSSVTNGNTTLSMIPNGTAVASQFIVYNNSDPTDAGKCVFYIDSTVAIVSSDRQSASGTYVPLTFRAGGPEQARIATDGTFTAGGLSTAPALKVTPVASQARWIEVTGATSSGNPTLGVSGGIFAISASVAITGVVSTSGYNVATLPGGKGGQPAHGTDALAPAYGVAVAGAGAVTIPVFYNGAAWICA